MRALFFMKLFTVLSIAAAIGCSVVSSSSKAVDLKDVMPEVAPETATTAKGMQTAVFAGGCFWGVEAVFERVKGVTDVVSGYSGGDAKTANYDDVSDGKTAHAEAVKITYDPTKVTYQQLLFVFFSVAHDPTQLNYQGHDRGTQYRSAIFYSDEEQKKTTEAFIAAIEKSKAFTSPVVTQVVPLTAFYDAEKYHQDYLARNPKDPYIVMHDMPKLANLKKQFPDLWVEK
ncbi:MAG: peptide-methionine (S)-S-oxide reductase MsrA [Pyrinomonadaceae bacterium]|nr:peptide-methionine (S)-S-oxide reductase MsrA [Pyrinomonadaceae bacterium]